MNEHDSERIAGLLVGRRHGADRRSRRGRRRRAQHVLHPRERRQQALRPPRPAEGAEGVAARPADRGRRLPRPEGPRRSCGSGRRTSTSCSAPTTSRTRPTLLARARAEGPIVEILEEHEAYPSALPARREVDHAAWVTIQIGCDNSCAFCIVPSVRGKEVSRRMGDIVHEVEELARDGVVEITLLGQNVNSYGRDLGAGQYRPQFADLLRALDAVDGIERIRFTSPHPKDLRPETIAAMAECASVCEHLHLPLQSGSDRTLARMHRGYTAARYLERLARGARRDRRPRGHHRHHRRLPGRDRRRLRAHARGRRRGRTYDAAYTFVFSPRPGTEAATMTDDFVAPEVVQRAHAAAHRGGRAARAARSTRRASAGSRRCSSRARRRPTPAMWSGRTRQNKLAALRARRRHRGRASSSTVRVTSAAPHWLRGELIARVRPAPPAAGAHPGRGGVTRHLALVGPTASGKSALALADRAAARATSRSCRSTRCRCTAASTSAPPSRRAPSAPRSCTTSSTSPIPSEEWSVQRTQVAARAAIADIEARGQRARARRRDRPLRARGRRRSRRSRRPIPTSRDALDRAADDDAGLARAYARLGRARSGRGGAHGARQPPAHRARARSDRAHRPAVLVVRARASTSTRRPRSSVTMVGLAVRAGARSRRGSRPASTAMRAAGLVDEVRGARRPAARRARPREAIGYREVLAHLAGEIPTLDDAFDAAVRRTRQFARRQRVWFRRDPARRSGSARRTSAADLAADACWHAGSDAATVAAGGVMTDLAARPSCTPPATTSSCSSRSTPTSPSSTPVVVVGAVRPAPRHRRRRAHHDRARAATAPTAR